MFHSEQCGSCVGVCLWFVRSRQQLSPPLAIRSQFQLVISVVTHGAAYFLCDSYVKYSSAGRCRRKFRRKFHDEIIPSRQTINNLVNKLRTTELLMDKKRKHKRRVLTEKLHYIGARLEHTPRKSLKRLDQETGASKSSARTVTHLLKPSSESWCLVCCKCKKECCTCVF
jgi:hypothetical protein